MSTNWEKYSKLIPKKLPGKSGRNQKQQVMSHSSSVIHDNGENWFDDEDLEISKTTSYKPSKTAEEKIGKYLAIDCEMVGVGPDGVESALARVTLVNLFGHVILDKYVKPKEKVTDFRTHVSGISPENLINASTLESVQLEVSQLFKGRILIGHAIEHDLKALFISHPFHAIRDTSKYKEFKKVSMGRKPALRKLATHFLKKDIQTGSHSSVEDARATMELYRLVKDDWEARIRKSKAMKSLIMKKNSKK